MGNPSRGHVKALWFQTNLVVHSKPKLLFAPQIMLGGLNGDMAKQELDLIELPTGKMTEPGARASEIVRC